MLGLVETTQGRRSGDSESIPSSAREVQLPYLYFLPDVSKANDVSLVPIISSRYSATWKIGQYVNRLLRPVMTRILESKWFLNDAHFIQKLNAHVHAQRRLPAATLFCWLRISNFYALAPHKDLLDVVGYFLQDHLPTPRLEGLSLSTVKNLLQLFLYNNMFCYKKGIYTVVEGSPSTMSLSDTLSNIYLFEWQRVIGKGVEASKECFGRHRDQLFFTWNGSSQALQTFLGKVTAKYLNVQVQTSFGSSVRFMDVHVENQHGQLFTRVYAEPTPQCYTLPYVCGHPKLNHGQWFRSALVRAVCCSSLIDDFQQERIRLELAFLASGYSVMFVESHVQHFFSYFHADMMRFLTDQTQFTSFRRRLFDFLDQHGQRCGQLQRLDDQGRLMRFEYHYELGPRCQFNERFQQLWSTYLTEHPNLVKGQSKIVLTTKHRHSLNALLSRTKALCGIQK